MKKGLIFLAFMQFVFINILAQIQEYCSGSTTVMEGEYNVMNNVWGSVHGDQCIEVDPDTSYFKVSLSTHNSSAVASYPSIFKGCHWGWCTTKDNPFPKKISEIESAPLKWVTSSDTVTGTWNVAYESWFSAFSEGSNYDGELMVWIGYNGGAGPAGTKVARITVGGHEWDVYFVAWDSWNYIAYKITTPVDSIDLDFQNFIHDACKRGYLLTTWYMHNMEAGFEIWKGGQGLTTHSYLASISEGTLTENYAPVIFRLKSPRNETSVESLDILFEWTESIDPDEDNIEYIFHLSGPEIDTTINGITADSLNFNGNNSLQFHNTYTWYVEATDGEDTTVCNSSYEFTTGVIDGINLAKSTPQNYLKQNYPNPFNSITTISYSTPKAGHVNLKIYNLLGEEVQNLINKFQPVGSYSINYDGNNLKNGIYYYKLQIDNQIFGIKKMSFIK